MQIIPFPAHYQSVYTNFDISSFSLISCKVKGQLSWCDRWCFAMQNLLHWLSVFYKISRDGLTVNFFYFNPKFSFPPNGCSKSEESCCDTSSLPNCLHGGRVKMGKCQHIFRTSSPILSATSHDSFCGHFAICQIIKTTKFLWFSIFSLIFALGLPQWWNW